MKKFVIALAIAATTATMPYANAGPRRADDVGLHLKHFADKLGLSDAQKQQIAAIQKADQDKNAPLVLDLRAKRDQYRQLKQANDPRADAVRAQLKAAFAQLRAARQATRDQILNVLTPEQRTLLQQLIEQRRHHH